MSKRWTEKELDILKLHYNKPYAVLMKVLPGRTKRALKHKIGDLGLQRLQRRKWTDEEYDILPKSV